MLGQGACSGDPARADAELCVSVPASPAAGTALRQAVRSLVDLVMPAKAEEVELLVTELATNGVKHARPERDNRITLDAKVDDRRLHVAVRDRGTGFDPERRPQPRAEPGGWGLVLVDGLADRWGVELEPTTVWFELGRDRLVA